MFPLLVRGQSPSVSKLITLTTRSFDIRFLENPGVETQSQNRTETTSGAFRI